MPVEKTATLPFAWRLIWILVGGPVAALWTLGLVWHIYPTTWPYRDLTQDWLSARCYFEGLPIYTPHEESFPRFFGHKHERGEWNVKVNAHPPVSVLVLLPIAALPHDSALLAWNLASLAMLGTAVWLTLGPRGLNCDSWCRLAAYFILICGPPLASQAKYSQLTALLVLLLAVAWMSDRRGNAIGAGICVGLATSIKLFPGFMLLYLLCQARWKALGFAIGAILALHAVAAIVFGPQQVLHYFRDVIPQINEWRSSWINCSFAGFWSRLFNVTDGGTRELFHSPTLAQFLTFSSDAALTGWLSWRMATSRGQVQRDLAFGATIVAMLLVTPVTWDHNLLLLIIPISIAWFYLATTPWRQFLLAAICFVPALEPQFQIWRLCLGSSSIPVMNRVATPWEAIFVLPIVTYCLLALLALLLWGLRIDKVKPKCSESPTASPSRNPINACCSAGAKL